MAFRGGKWTAEAALLALVVALPVAGCDCSGEEARSLAISSPSDGAMITLADDEDAALEGVQITVTIDSTGFSLGDEVALLLDPSGTAGTPIATGEFDATGIATIPGVTLPPGEHVLRATAGSVQSRDVTVTVIETCAVITYVTPAPSGRITLGPADDEDGTACGDSFSTEVVVSTNAPEGTDARLYVNGTPRGTSVIDGMIARFADVVLDNRGATPNRLSVEVTNSAGVTCQQDFPGEILVDCEGVSCAITLPDAARPYLNASDDVSAAPGFQATFEVETESALPVRLVIDGDEEGAREAVPTSSGMINVAQFATVPLEEGVHRFSAVCVDDAGNTTRSGVAEWTVDITPCGVAIARPSAGELITLDDDQDTTVDGIQIDATGTVTGTDCGSIRAGVCPLDGAFTALVDDAFSERITLATSASQDVCVEVQDVAGNVGSATVTVDVRTDAPQLEIVTPATGTAFNTTGAGGRTADLMPASPTCEAAFTVYCTEAGTDVTLHRASTGTLLVGGTATCAADASVPAPYAGIATFASVSLPSIDSGMAINVVARQALDGLVGMSTPVTLSPDCSAPQLTGWSEPTSCPAIFRPSDDSDPAMPGLQHDIRVFHTTPMPRPDVVLTVTNSATGGVVTMRTSSIHTITTTDFFDVDFSSGGDLSMSACATDAAGNTTCITCMVTVGDLPTLTITEPAMGAVLTEANDCDPATAGLQIRVRATTDAAAGSTATVQIGASSTTSTTVSGGVVDVCASAPEGAARILVQVTDPARGMASAMVDVSIDSTPPAEPIDDLTATPVDRRGGVVRFQWTAVSGDLVDYEIRCDDAAITTEAQWSAATVMMTTGMPGSPGAVQTEDVAGFRPGQTVYCTLRGIDIAGRLTPIGNSVSIDTSFMERTGTVAGSAQLGAAIVAVGDVNGDGFDDVLAGAPTFESTLPGNGDAYLFFGSASGPSATAGVTFTGPDPSFGATLASIGDFNGDGRGDFAIGALADVGGLGAVYVFYGRTASAAWPAAIDVSAGSCTADLCLYGAGATGMSWLGYSISSADFNGDGLHDVIIGAPFAVGDTGRVFVVLGSSGFPANASFNLPLGATVAASASHPAGFYFNPPAGRYLGAAVLSPGQIAGGAEHDLLASAVGDGSMAIAGRLFQTLGRPYPAAATGLVQITAAELTTVDMGTAGNFGDWLTAADFNGDGRIDVALLDSSGAGTVYVYLHTGTGFGASSRITITNDVPNGGMDLFGIAAGLSYHPWLGALGDLDGNGFHELALGSYQRGTEVGSVDLFFGRSSPASTVRTAADLVFQPSMEAGYVRRTAAFIGDVNGDGFGDFAVGDTGFGTSAGRVLFYY